MSKFLFIIFSILTINLHGQPCQGYFPIRKGAMMEITNYNEKGKMQSVNSISITGNQQTDDDSRLSVHSEIKDEKGRVLGTSDYDAFCEKGSFFINLKCLISAEQYKAWQDMTLSVKADDIDYPLDYFPGQKLNDAHLLVDVSMNEMNMPGMTVNVTERIIEGTETITTPAGTFDCIKITSRQKIKNIITYEVKATEWLSLGSGIVKTEVYRKEKLKGYSELTKLVK